MTTKTITATLKTVDAETRRIAGRASCEPEDHMGDCVVARGISLAAYLRNPVLLGDHDRTFILGRVTRLWVADTADGPALLFEATVLPAGTSARIDERWAAIQAGAGVGISIGFLVVEAEPRQASGGRVGARFTKTTLLEISSVALPACPTCLVEQRSACACGGGAETLDLDGTLDVDIDDDSFRGDVIQTASRILVPALVARAAVARPLDEQLDLVVEDDAADDIPITREDALEAIRVAIPMLLREQFNRLKGLVD